MENTHVGRAKRGELTMLSPLKAEARNNIQNFKTLLIDKREFWIIIVINAKNKKTN